VTARYAEMVGRYRLEVTSELRAFIERAFVESAPASHQAAVRAAALDEASGSELELHADGTLVSRSGAQEFVRVRLPTTELDDSGILFEKAPGVGVRLEIHDPDTLIAHQAGKPAARFRRQR
jgi:hypothetical protein